MASVPTGGIPVMDENVAQQGSSSLIKRIPSESTVNRIDKQLHVPASGITWERSQSAANIEAATSSDSEEDKTRNNNTNVEPQTGGTREAVTSSTVSGQTKNYWDLPSAISHEDEAQRDKLLSNNAQFSAAKKRRGAAPFRTSLETISQHDELQLCGNSDANSYESVLTVDEPRSPAAVYHKTATGCVQPPTAVVSSPVQPECTATCKPTQQLISAHAGAHRTVSCDVMLPSSATREVAVREATATPSQVGASYASAALRGTVQRTRSGSSNQPQITAVANQLGTTSGSSNLLETESASSNLLESASGASSNSNLIGSAGGSTANVIGTSNASNLLGTRLFGGANLNLAAVGDRDEPLTDNEPSSNVSASSSVVFGTPLTSNSRVEVVVITTPNGSDSDLNQ